MKNTSSTKTLKSRFSMKCFQRMISSKNGLVLNTNGKGLWSTKQRAVKIIDFYYAEYGEFCAYFDDSWRNKWFGLIYTDPQFIKELRAAFMAAGMTKAEAYELDYTEQGMQGDDYVSLEGGKKFREAWFAGQR